MSLPVDPWPVDWATCTDVAAASPAATGKAVLAATEILGSLAGGQFGLTSVTVRPCKRGCWPVPAAWALEWPIAVGWPYPLLVNGAWVNLSCLGCGGSCACSSLQEAVLPGPVHDVTQVKVDGIVLASSAYRLDRDPAAPGDLLVRTDGGAWPSCNDLSKPDTQVGTWSVTARYGMPVPKSGELAVGEFACEWLKAMRGDEACRLPRTVTSIARQGVTIQLPNPTSLLEAGRLGLPLCDLFLEAVNPRRLRSRPRVLSPDTLGPRRTGL